MNNSETVAIKVDNLSKVFKLPHEKHNSVKSILVRLGRGRGYEMQQVLKNVSFDIKEGEFYGIVGRNGSGKSTLLKLLAGIYMPTGGSIQVSGNLTPFIELGVGFNAELTGRENVYLNGALLGFSRSEMDKMYDGIVQFAELGKFMDQKLKNYSSGMQVRLAFSIAIRANSDILLIDEVLAVGDASFQQKCYNYFKELKKQKKTVVFVTHDTNALKEYCTRGILIEEGRIVSEGKISTVVNDYSDLISKQEELRSQSEDVVGKANKQKNRWGNGYIRVDKLTSSDSSTGAPKTVFSDKDDKIILTVEYVASKWCDEPVYGLTINDGTGQSIFVSNTLWLGTKTNNLNANGRAEVRWEIPNMFNTGDYYVSPAVAGDKGYVPYDWRENFGRFKVRKSLQSTGITNIKHQIKLK